MLKHKKTVKVLQKGLDLMCFYIFNCLSFIEKKKNLVKWLPFHRGYPGRDSLPSIVMETKDGAVVEIYYSTNVY